jgi:hypothetical protein
MQHSQDQSTTLFPVAACRLVKLKESECSGQVFKSSEASLFSPLFSPLDGGSCSGTAKSGRHGKEKVAVLCSGQRKTGGNLSQLVSTSALMFVACRRSLLYLSRSECETQVKGASGAKFKGFPTHDEAHEYIKQLNWDYKVQHERAQQQLPLSTTSQSGDNGSSSQHAIVVDDEDDSQEQKAGPSRGRSNGNGREVSRQIEKEKKSASLQAKKVKNSKRIAALEESPRQASERIAALHTSSQQSSGYDTTLEVQSRPSTSQNAAMYIGSSQTSKRSAASEATSYQSNKKPRINVVELDSSSSPCTDLVVQKSSQVRTIEVYTDGACTDNGKLTARAGWGVYWPEGQGDDLRGLNESKRLPGDRSQQTNNRAELMGLIRAVQLCPDPDAQLVIYTDSQYCINGKQR